MTSPTDHVRCDHCGGMFLARDLDTLRANGAHDPRLPEPHEATAAQIRDAILARRPDLAVAVHQTGGGTATMFVGEPDANGRYWLSIGPGSYDWSDPWRSTFGMAEADTSVGPDDDGTAEPVFPNTVDGIADTVAGWCECRGCDATQTYTHGLCAYCIEACTADRHVPYTDDPEA